MESSAEEYFACPYCGQENSILIDFTASGRQRLITDCETCCHPIVISVKTSRSEILEFRVQAENE